ncbi:PAAR domain-containing protein [Parasedimentitalea psychrophila]|uniref:PAAR domain-containing protein n=1 Tax=Parasedimentitalea psychrophila TaxID=2997337 RepID=A0A9Y2KV88_9RHOB|nr:PAAR domain-containing protein [Parasedimentitalea psychrophila]WIY23786.1 PAAR domain-containing protein [Parasedimentitalea psychrophila]
MPAVTRKGDSCTGHGAFSPRASTGGSGNVLANGISVHRQGDGWAAHCIPGPLCHGGSLASGSGSVSANGQQLGRIGEPVDCRSSVAGGSVEFLRNER